MNPRRSSCPSTPRRRSRARGTCSSGCCSRGSWAASSSDPRTSTASLRPGVRGNRFARAGLETAAWDLEASRRGTGLAALVAERVAAAPAATIPCGVALGIPEDRSPKTLARWVDRGARRRATGGSRSRWPRAGTTRRCARRAMALAGSGIPLTVDANGAYAWPADEAALRALDEAGLLYIEQPLAPGRAGRTRPARPRASDAHLPRRDAPRRGLGAAGRRDPGPEGLEPEGPSGGWADRGESRSTGGDPLRRGALGRHVPESGIGSQAAIWPSRAPRVRVPVGSSSRAPAGMGAGADVIELTMSPDGYMRIPDRSTAGLLRSRPVSRRCPLSPPPGGAAD